MRSTAFRPRGEQGSGSIDGTIGQLSKVDEPTALKAVSAAHQQHREWAGVPLALRKDRVGAAVDAMTAARDDLALLAW